jgi:hypothetical protein
VFAEKGTGNDRLSNPRLSAEAATIDLNGFAIRGTTGSDAGAGISSSSPETTVVNGSILRMGAEGIVATDRAHVERVNVRDCGGVGISLRVNGIVRNVTVRTNQGGGISLSTSSLVESSHISGNTGDGIEMNAGIVRNSTLISNSLDGVDLGVGLVLGNEIRFSGGLGIRGSVGYGHNLLQTNNSNGPQVDASAVEIDTNVCSGNTTCP